MTIPWIGRFRGPRNRASRRRQDAGQPGRGEASGPQDEAAAKARRHWQISISIGVVLLLVIFGVAAAGYYEKFYSPPRVWAGNVNDVEFNMGDLVARIRVLQGANRYEGGQVDLSTVPFEYLQDLIHAEVLRQASPGLGIVPTEEDIGRALRLQFEPGLPAGQEADPGQLEQEFQNNYQTFLTTTGLDDADYRIIIEERLTRLGLFTSLAETVADTMEQVEVQWIHLPLERPTQSGSGVQPLDVLKRLEVEEFRVVASEVSESDGFADTFGYVGWVPRGAFPDFDGIFFGEPARDIEPLMPGETSEPIYSDQAVYIVQVLSGPEVQPLSDLIRAKFTVELVDEWQAQQLQDGADGGWVKMNFNSELYAWVADQVAVTRPRLETPPQ